MVRRGEGRVLVRINSGQIDSDKRSGEKLLFFSIRSEIFYIELNYSILSNILRMLEDNNND